MRPGVWLIAVLAMGCGQARGDGDGTTDELGETEDVSVDTGGEPVDPAEPIYEVGVYETVIGASDDPATVHFPVGEGVFPVVLLLQGANVGRVYYSAFAGIVASYGFVVVVPDHESTGIMGTGLYAQQSEIEDVLEHMRGEAADPGSPVAGIVDAGRLVVVGHSYGGVCGLGAIRDVCQVPFCTGGLSRPVELVAGAFWGTNLAMPIVGTVPVIENDSIPVALIQGSMDSLASMEDARETYDRIQDPPRILVEVAGADHYSICDVDDPEGAQADPAVPSIDRAVGIETIGRWMALFLRAHVLGEVGAWTYVHVDGDGLDPNARVVIQQP